MCGSITYYNGSGSYTDRIMCREDFLERIKEAINYGEKITYKVTTPDKSFKRAVNKIVSDEYGMYEEQRERGCTFEEMSFSFDEIPF